MPACLRIGLLAVSLGFPTALLSQEQSFSPHPSAAPYANTTDGLKQLLVDMRAAAKDGNQERLAAFIKNTEVPNCDAWLHKMYDSDKADSWMGLCEAKSRDARERDMRDLFGQIATQDGRIITRKVNDNPRPGKGLEWGWLQAIKRPLDIYWASWLPSSVPKESEADPIGYFMFIDGAFRWESTIQSFKPSVQQQTKSPSMGTAASGIEMLSDSEGVDFNSYLRNVYLSVKKRWFANMPSSVGKGQQGTNTVEFRIMQDGSVPTDTVKIVAGSGNGDFDNASSQGIIEAAPFNHLPEPFSKPFIVLRFSFYYNLPIPQSPH